jgi:hypothetical protein
VAARRARLGLYLQLRQNNFKAVHVARLRVGIRCNRIDTHQGPPPAPGSYERRRKLRRRSEDLPGLPSMKRLTACKRLRFFTKDVSWLTPTWSMWTPRSFARLPYGAGPDPTNAAQQSQSTRSKPIALGWKNDMWRTSHANQAAFDGHSGRIIQSDGQTTGMNRTVFSTFACRPIVPRQRDRFDRN